MKMILSFRNGFLGSVVLLVMLGVVGGFAGLALADGLSDVDSLDGKMVTIKNGGWMSSQLLGGFGPSVADGCLDVHGAVAVNARDVRLWQCNGTDAQKFTLEKRDSGEYAGYYRLVSQAGRGSHCVDNRGEFRHGGAINLWSCLDDDHHNVRNQSVWIDRHSNGYFSFAFVEDRQQSSKRFMSGEGYNRNGGLDSELNFRGNVESSALGGWRNVVYGKFRYWQLYETQ